MWPTPVTNEGNETPESWSSRNRSMKEKNPLLGALHKKLSTVVQEVPATWPTPITNDATGSTYCYGKMKPDGSREIFMKLPGMVQATWPTPTTPNGGRSPKDGAMTTTGQTPDGKKRQVDVRWVADQIVSGPPTSGSPDQTESRGALAPTFPCWLMGYPIIWDECAPKDMPKKSKR
jgi:hypothetical protein